MIFKALTILLSIAAISCVQSDVSDAASSEETFEPIVIDPALQRFVSNFEKKLGESFARHRVPGAAVAIVIDSSITYLKAFGKKSSKGVDSVNLETLFRLASVSKGFASILTGKVLTGNGEWEDPISKYISDFEVNPGNLADSISISHILSHTSGYPYQTYSTLIEDGIKRHRLFQELKKIKLSRKPGAIHSYQNVAYSLIEPVIESITDTTYQYALKSLIFNPLNMKTASLTYEGIKNSGNLAQPHGLKRIRYIPIKLSPAYYNVAAAGGINASIIDMSEWLKALLGQRPDVIPEAILEDVFTPQIRTSVKNYHFGNFDRPRKGHYGYGWRIVEYPNDTLIYHGGYANGFKSELGLDRSKNVAICILSNAPSRFCNEMVVDFFKEYKKYLYETKSLNSPNYLEEH